MAPDIMRQAPGGANQPKRRPAAVDLVVPANATAVRNALSKVLTTLHHSITRSGTSGTVELVLAEVMNNIVEHAYAGQTNGIIQLSIRECRTCLFAKITDSGLPLPDHALPSSRFPELIGDQAFLPEGGFGWALINSMTENRTYTRHDGQNYFSFSIPFQPQRAAKTGNAAKMPN